MAKFPILTTLLLLSFFPISSSVFPSDTLLEVAQRLGESGFVAMSQTLEIARKNLVSDPSSSITIFAPSDEAFKHSGQPTLNLLLHHILPSKLSIKDLKTVSRGQAIQTVFDKHYLIKTSSASDQQISLNNITINTSAMFDSGSVVVYAIDNFFDPSFQDRIPNSSIQCIADQQTCFREITDALAATRYSVFGEFLDLQLFGFDRSTTKLTIFAPDDDEMRKHLRNFGDYGSIFRRHVVPCKLTVADLANETEVSTFLKGYTIRITKSGGKFALSGVPILRPDLYSSDRVVVHGIEKMLDLQGEQGISGDYVSGFHGISGILTVLLMTQIWMQMQ